MSTVKQRLCFHKSAKWGPVGVSAPKLGTEPWAGALLRGAFLGIWPHFSVEAGDSWECRSWYLPNPSILSFQIYRQILHMRTWLSGFQNKLLLPSCQCSCTAWSAAPSVSLMVSTRSLTTRRISFLLFATQMMFCQAFFFGHWFLQGQVAAPSPWLWHRGSVGVRYLQAPVVSLCRPLRSQVRHWPQQTGPGGEGTGPGWAGLGPGPGLWRNPGGSRSPGTVEPLILFLISLRQEMPLSSHPVSISLHVLLDELPRCRGPPLPAHRLPPSGPSCITSFSLLFRLWWPAHKWAAPAPREKETLSWLYNTSK